jgi:hypothetical protein
MNSAVEGTEVLGLTSEYFGARRPASGNWNERIEFAWASTFIGTLLKLRLTPVQRKSSLNPLRFPAFDFQGRKYQRGASSMAPLKFIVLLS